ncbi:MAG: DUF1778 domain-containing protein [Armatimonadota bacterium]|nr:DUF1778 domain-containing protein [Armatimonadota bacterium]
MANALKKTKEIARRASKETPKTGTTAARQRRASRDRLNCRIDTRIKQRAEEAASLLGQDLTAFTETALNEKAQEVLEREARIVLSERDFQRFLDSINHPDPPTPELQRARQAYRQMSQEHPEGNW